MSVVGFDVGDFKSCVAVARRNGVDVLLNKESKRETPSMVSFGTKQRAIGTDGSSAQSMNPKNTVFGIKQLLGKKFKEQGVQNEIPYLPFKVKEGADGGCLVEVMYLNEKVELTPERLMAMVLTDLVTIAEGEMNGEKVKDCVVSIPNYYAESERSAMLDAIDIAGLKCLRLIPDTTATALAFGIYKTDLHETDALNVAFVDVGHASLQVSITAFTKGKMNVLSQAFDRELGGRTFDNILFDHFTKQFLETKKLDIRSNARASLRLRKELVKVKKILSANSSASFALECIMDDQDVRGSITREEFEHLSEAFIAKVIEPCQKAVEDAGLAVGDVTHIELVGAASRIPIVASKISEFFGREISRNLNVSECVSKGCALQCAMLSPVFRVRDYDIQDYCPYDINFSWKKEASEEVVSSALFPKGNTVPSIKMLTFLRNEAFSLQASYSDAANLPGGMDRLIGQYDVGPIKPAKGDGKTKLKVQVRLNLHGTVEVESVHSIEEEEYEVEVIPEKPAAKPETPAEDEEMKDAEDASKEAPKEEAPKEEAPKEEEPAPEPKKELRKRTLKVNVPFKSTKTLRMATADVKMFMSKEVEMKQADLQEELTKEARNNLEGYILSARSKLYDSWNDYVTEDDRSKFSKTLDETEDWMYDEGEDEAREVYVKKTDFLRGIGDPIEERHMENEKRGPAAQGLVETCNMFTQLATSEDAKYSHITAEEKGRVLKECQTAMTWLSEKIAMQDNTPKTVSPIIMSFDIIKKKEVIQRVCEPIMSKPAPAPPKEEKKKEEESKEASPMEEDKEEKKEESPMETDGVD
ncbi:heat shock protein Hsp70 [Chloropicon primus]|uniref:Heat shock protein Hsp70 n=2 Tax=Chloropicon primus TaxID=1764295 RepID=A0A5B8MKD7_9CHLO|nr:heat shock protein Hsp70 [Chloropicon primus]UPR00156.1 heat shock protein Hsp70 [Chloropicon primus]|eukprot:QDZ20946.1 heat shock protein Hsp70 [Chloropicon primus]